MAQPDLAATSDPQGTGLALRWRLSSVVAAVIFLASAVQGLAYFLLHSDAQPGDFVGGMVAGLLPSLAGWVVAYGVVRSMVRPLEELTAAASALARGDLTRRTDHLEGAGRSAC